MQELAGIGGNRKLWGDTHEITAIENNPEIAAIYQSFFPNDKVIIADAHTYLLEHYKEFDFIWSSPPCITHTRINKNFGKVRYADLKLYEEIILLQTWFKGKWVVENVIPYYKPLLPFQQIGRHYYWANFIIEQKIIRNPPKETNLRSQRKNKRGTYDGDILNMTLSKGIFDLKEFKISTARKDQILRNCVEPKTALNIFNCAFKTKQLMLDLSKGVPNK